MRFAFSIGFGSAAALLTSTVSAQVVFTGVIKKSVLPSICQEETHYLTCTAPDPSVPSGVLLKSSTLDLAPYVGKLAKFSALPRGVTCTIYDVYSVQVPPTATLVTCGTPAPGCTVRFRVGPTGVIGQYWLFLSTSPAFVPLDPTLGTLLIGPPIVFVAQGPTAGLNSFVDVHVPPDPSLTGLDFWLQGARRDIGPIGEIELANSVCLTILPPTAFCATPDC